jgi:hypothetical protein
MSHICSDGYYPRETVPELLMILSGFTMYACGAKSDVGVRRIAHVPSDTGIGGKLLTGLVIPIDIEPREGRRMEDDHVPANIGISDIVEP